MASIVISQLAASAGGAVAGSVGSAIGMAIGSYIGSQLEGGKSSGRYQVNGPRLTDLMVQSSSYGRVIPVVYGTTRLAGNIIWARPITERAHAVYGRSPGKGGGSRNRQVGTEYSYSVTLAIAITEGPIDAVLRVWADTKQLPAHLGKYRLYKGTNDQLPDPLIESFEGIGKTPAYRGLAYVVIEDFLLSDYGNRIPNFTFEVQKRPAGVMGTSLPVEDMIRGVNIIPGAGEFVYDTVVQNKVMGMTLPDGSFVQQGLQSAINQNNRYGKADSLVSLDQLQEACRNVEWAAPVVTWFATSTDLAICEIKPAVEYKGGSTCPDNWQVGSFVRDNAHQVSLDAESRPSYGGTINDASLMRYLVELKARRLKVMLYPMFFMDTPGKPWRGRLTGKHEQVKEFFTKPGGYNQFILHYAQLVKGLVDAFVIGSELIGLTKITSGNGHFPAVNELVQLASRVKDILGEAVTVTYAADWSEYHHSEGGWYNLDLLWACDAIDVVGIDAYFPLTERSASCYNEQEIMAGWEEGEGYDFYYEDEARTSKKPLPAAYAWKNLQWWWENHHYNPGGAKTAWQPKSKKIWFTEYGFPSVDCCSNQPNVFYDPKSSESNLPRYSSGKTDFRAQKVAIRASLKKWQDSEMITNMFLWAWDGRPYPFWPSMLKVWSDGPAWQRGHWINGKFGNCGLAQVVAEICLSAGLQASEFDVSKLDDFVDGYMINYQQTAREAIESLQAAYFFDSAEIDGKICFMPRWQDKPCHKIEPGDLLAELSITRSQEADLPARCDVLYLDRITDYGQGVESVRRHMSGSGVVDSVSLPLVLCSPAAKWVAEVMLYNRWLERTSYSFMLPVKYANLRPGSIVELKSHVMRLTKISFGASRALQCQAVAEDLAIYQKHQDVTMPEMVMSHNGQNKTIFHLLDLPLLPGDDAGGA